MCSKNQIKNYFQQCERTAGCTEFILAKEKDCFLFFTDQERIPDSEATDIQTLMKTREHEKSDLTSFWLGKNDRYPTGSDRYGSCGYRTVSPSPFLFVSKQILLDQKRIQPYSKSLPWTKFKRKFSRKFAFRIGSKNEYVMIT